MTAFPDVFCESLGYNPGPVSCPVPLSYYFLPITLLAIGFIAIALGLGILVRESRRRRASGGAGPSDPRP